MPAASRRPLRPAPRAAAAPAAPTVLVLLAVSAVLAVVGGLLLTTTSASADAAGVARAQRRLNQLGCDAGVVDGGFGEHTRTAVVRFQSRHALTQSGRLDPATRQRLYATTAHACDDRPVPRSGTGRRIVISQRQNWVWLVRSDGSVAAQGGIVDNPAELPRGSYRTGSYCGRAAKVLHDRAGSLILDRFTRFAPCGIGFHRIPRDGSRQIHADYYLGTDLQTSHGCVRLSLRTATRIWDFVGSRHTPVRVV